jgi:hypothetical protein
MRANMTTVQVTSNTALFSLFESCHREDLSEEDRSVLDGYEKGDTVDYLVNVGTCHEMGVEYEEVFSGRLASLMRGDCIRLRGDEGRGPVVVIHQYPVAGLGVKSPGKDSTKTDQLGKIVPDIAFVVRTTDVNDPRTVVPAFVEVGKDNTKNKDAQMWAQAAAIFDQHVRSGTGAFVPLLGLEAYVSNASWQTKLYAYTFFQNRTEKEEKKSADAIHASKKGRSVGKRSAKARATAEDFVDWRGKFMLARCLIATAASEDDGAGRRFARILMTMDQHARTFLEPVSVIPPYPVRPWEAERTVLLRPPSCPGEVVKIYARDSSRRPAMQLGSLAGCRLLYATPEYLVLAYPYTKGNSTPKCVGAFIPILEQLLHLHEKGFLEEQQDQLKELAKHTVGNSSATSPCQGDEKNSTALSLCHGDIRLANMVFNEDDPALSKLIDFDMGGAEGTPYPEHYSTTLTDTQRHDHARELREMRQHHDWFSLGKVMAMFRTSNGQWAEAASLLIQAGNAPPEAKPKAPLQRALEKLRSIPLSPLVSQDDSATGACTGTGSPPVEFRYLKERSWNTGTPCTRKA